MSIGSGSNAIPDAPLPASEFLTPTVLAFAKDLHVYRDTEQMISYTIFGSAPSRSVKFDFLIAVHNNPSALNRFSVVFYEDVPDVVRVNYMHTYDQGRSVAPGVQSRILPRSSISSIVRLRR